MANSKKKPHEELSLALDSALRGEVFPHSRLCLGLSGGLDSVVLLHLLREWSQKIGFSLSALHVDHQISPNSGAWARFCRDLCAKLDIPVAVRKVSVAEFASHGAEGAARAARYAEFEKIDADYLVLAQHLDDQAETVLLQLLRGAGAKGLAAMAQKRDFGRLTVLRPFLAVERKTLREYAEACNFSWVEDESNASSGPMRNRLRLEILPLIEKGWPAYRETLFRAAQHFSEAETLLHELAEIDGERAMRDDKLDLAVLSALPYPRAKNLLRHFLDLHGLRMPASARIEEMLREFCRAAPDAESVVAHDGRELRAFAGMLYVLPVVKEEDFFLPWAGEAAVRLPIGEVVFSRGPGGIDEAKLAGEVSLRSRRGGERMKIDARRPTRTLKNLLQEFAIPPWQRRRMPLLFCNEALVWAPGIGVAASHRAEWGLLPEWRECFPGFAVREN